MDSIRKSYLTFNDGNGILLRPEAVVARKNNKGNYDSLQLKKPQKNDSLQLKKPQKNERENYTIGDQT